MATVAQLDIKYGAQTSGAEAGTKKVQGLIGGLTSGARGLATVAGGIVLGGAITALVGNVGRLATAGINFGGEMANVNSILQLSDEGIAQLSDQVIQLSSDPRVLAGPAELAEGLYNIASSGFAGTEGLQVLEAASLAATAGVTTTDVAARAITASLNAYGLGADKAGYVSDVLFGTVDKGVISFEELANNLGNTLPVANALGIGIEELGAAYALMTLKGVPASQAETQIAGIMRSALNPTEALTAAVGAHGFASAEAAIASEGMAGFLGMVMEASGGSKEALFDMLGTQEAVNAALILGAENGEDFNDMLAAVTEGTEGVGATQRALEKQMKSSRFAIAQARKQVEILATIVMGALSPAITFLASGFSKLISGGIMPFIQSIRDLREGGLNPVEAALTAVQMALARIGGEDTPAVIAAIARGFGDLADLAGGLGDALGQVIDAFQALVAGDFDGFFAGLEAAADTAFAAISQFAGITLDWVLDTAVPTVIGWVADNAGNVWDGIKSLVGWAWDAFADLGGWALNVAIPAIVGGITSIAGNIANWILGYMKSGVAGSGDGTGGPSPFGDLGTVELVKAWAVSVARPAIVGGITGIAGNIANWITGFMRTGVSSIGDGTGGPEPFGDLGTVDLVKAWSVSIAIPTVVGAITSMAGRLGDWLRDYILNGSAAMGGPMAGAAVGGGGGGVTVEIAQITVDVLDGIASLTSADVEGWIQAEIDAYVNLTGEVGQLTVDLSGAITDVTGLSAVEQAAIAAVVGMLIWKTPIGVSIKIALAGLGAGFVIDESALDSAVAPVVRTLLISWGLRAFKIPHPVAIAVAVTAGVVSMSAEEKGALEADITAQFTSMTEGGSFDQKVDNYTLWIDIPLTDSQIQMPDPLAIAARLKTLWDTTIPSIDNIETIIALAMPEISLPSLADVRDKIKLLFPKPNVKIDDWGADFDLPDIGKFPSLSELRDLIEEKLPDIDVDIPDWDLDVDLPSIGDFPSTSDLVALIKEKVGILRVPIDWIMDLNPLGGDDITPERIGSNDGGGGGKQPHILSQVGFAAPRSSLADMLAERKAAGGGTVPIMDYSPLIAAANAARQAVVAAFTNMQIEVATAMRNTITSAVGAFTPIVQALTNVGNQARQAVGAALTNLQIEAATTMGNVVISASAAFLPIVQNLTNSANQTRQAVGAAFINMQIEVNATLTAFVASASAQALTAGAQFNTNLSQGISAAQVNVQIKTADMITKLTTFASNARTQGLTAGQNFNQGLTQGMNAAVANTQIAMDRVKGALNIGSQYSVGHGIGYSMGQGINAGISAWTSAIAATASAAVTNAVAAARNAAGARSPSKVMMQLGADMMAGATIGIERASSDFSSAVRRSANDATSAFNPSARMAFSGRTAGGMGGGQNITIITLEPGKWAEFLAKAERGNAAFGQQSSRSREVGLGLRGI